MEASDSSLELLVRKWAASYDPPVATVATRTETRRGPPSVEVNPINSEAAPVSLWVSDDGAHVSISVGRGLWFDEAVPLDESPLKQLLESIAAGHVHEYVRKLFGRVVARRGTVGDPNSLHLTYGQLNPFAVIPGLRWESLGYKPYQARK